MRGGSSIPTIPTNVIPVYDTTMLYTAICSIKQIFEKAIILYIVVIIKTKQLLSYDQRRCSKNQNYYMSMLKIEHRAHS